MEDYIPASDMSIVIFLTTKRQEMQTLSNGAAASLKSMEAATDADFIEVWSSERVRIGENSAGPFLKHVFPSFV
jgi:hypothetical protein